MLVVVGCARPTGEVPTLWVASIDAPIARGVCAARAQAALTVDRRERPSRWPESAFTRQLTFGKDACLLRVEAKLGGSPDGPRISDGKLVEVRAGRVNVLGAW